MGSIEIEGETCEEALAKGLEQLGLSEGDVDVEKIESNRKVLGILGRSGVRLRLHYADSLARLCAAREALNRLIGGMGFEASVDAKLDDDDAHLNIRGEHLGFLIGRRGETLDALEYLVDRIVNRPPHERIRILLDAEGYRERSAEQVRALAYRLARKAKRQREPVSCRPMNSRDRRIVHMALRDDEEVETHSEGEGGFRRVVISPLY